MDDVIRLLHTNGVRYLLIGGQAMRFEGMPRFSMDWDILIPPHDVKNIEKINRLLNAQLDVPLVPLGERGENFIQTYQTPSGILQFHLGGLGLPDFDQAESRAVEHKTESGATVRCLSADDLLQSKLAANRPEDQADILFLQAKTHRASR